MLIPYCISSMCNKEIRRNRTPRRKLPQPRIQRLPRSCQATQQRLHSGQLTGDVIRRDRSLPLYNDRWHTSDLTRLELGNLVGAIGSCLQTHRACKQQYFSGCHIKVSTPTWSRNLILIPSQCTLALLPALAPRSNRACNKHKNTLNTTSSPEIISFDTEIRE